MILYLFCFLNKGRNLSGFYSTSFTNTPFKFAHTILYQLVDSKQSMWIHPENVSLSPVNGQSWLTLFIYCLILPADIASMFVLWSDIVYWTALLQTCAFCYRLLLVRVMIGCCLYVEWRWSLWMRSSATSHEDKIRLNTIAITDHW